MSNVGISMLPVAIVEPFSVSITARRRTSWNSTIAVSPFADGALSQTALSSQAM